MTAKETMDRADQLTKTLGEAYGRLQSELLRPLIDVALNILQKEMTMTTPLEAGLEAVENIEEGTIDIPAFTEEEAREICFMPMELLKPVLTEAQYNALLKFVMINQLVMAPKVTVVN